MSSEPEPIHLMNIRDVHVPIREAALALPRSVSRHILVGLMSQGDQKMDGEALADAFGLVPRHQDRFLTEIGSKLDPLDAVALRLEEVRKTSGYPAALQRASSLAGNLYVAAEAAAHEVVASMSKNIDAAPPNARLALCTELIERLKASHRIIDAEKNRRAKVLSDTKARVESITTETVHKPLTGWHRRAWGAIRRNAGKLWDQLRADTAEVPRELDDVELRELAEREHVVQAHRLTVSEAELVLVGNVVKALEERDDAAPHRALGLVLDSGSDPDIAGAGLGVGFATIFEVIASRCGGYENLVRIVRDKAGIGTNATAHRNAADVERIVARIEEAATAVIAPIAATMTAADVLVEAIRSDAMFRERLTHSLGRLASTADLLDPFTTSEYRLRRFVGVAIPPAVNSHATEQCRDLLRDLLATHRVANVTFVDNVDPEHIQIRLDVALRIDELAWWRSAGSTFDDFADCLAVATHPELR